MISAPLDDRTPRACLSGPLQLPEARGRVGGEDEHAGAVREARLDELAQSDLDPAARGERLGAGGHLADDLLGREQAGVMVEEQLEHGVPEIVHSSTGQRCSK